MFIKYFRNIMHPERNQFSFTGIYWTLKTCVWGGSCVYFFSFKKRLNLKSYYRKVSWKEVDLQDRVEKIQDGDLVKRIQNLKVGN